MKYIEVCEPVEFRNLKKKDEKTGKEGPLVYTFNEFLVQHIFGHKDWRKNKDTQDALFECLEKFEKAKPGDEVELTDKTFEVLEPIATMKGTNLNADVALEFNMLMRPVIMATKDPRTLPKAPNVEKDSSKEEPN